MNSASKTTFGLKGDVIQRMCGVFQQHEQIEKVIIYGSRAVGHQRNASDIDLTLLGDKLGLSDLSAVFHELDDLLLPYKIDLSILDHIKNEGLLDHIREEGQVFYMKHKSNLR